MTGLFVRHQATEKQLSQFGGIGGLLVLLSIWKWKENLLIVGFELTVATVFFGIAWFRPRWWSTPYSIASLIAYPIGCIVGEVTIFALYWFVVVPMGLMMRLCGVDPLGLRDSSSTSTYWKTKAQPKDVREYYRRF